jgi:hypothetical protein
MNINRQISYSVFTDITQIRESIVDSIDNYTSRAAIYSAVEDVLHASVWDSVEGGLVASIEREILDYEYSK